MAIIKQNKHINLFLWWLILGIIVVKLVLFISSNRNYFLRRFDPEYFGKLYSESQYVIGERSKGGIGDDGLYAFAGYFYLFKGGDVSSVNFEHPPLGKYLIGLSILVFQNENIINILYFILLLILTYKIGDLVLPDKTLSLLGVLILTFDPLFLDNLIRSLLDLPFTLFFVAGVYFFLKALTRPSLFYLSFLFWGGAFSTRFFPAFVFVYLYLLLLIYIYKRKYLQTYFISTALVSLVYLITHISFFIYHPSVMEFLRHKKWMLNWFTGSPVIFGNIWRNIITGTYIDSTGKLAVNEHWTIVLPLIVLFAITCARRDIFMKKKSNLFFLYGLSILYVLYLTIATYGVGKFLMPIYPLVIVLSLSHLSTIYSIIVPWKRLVLRKLKGK